MRTFTVTFCMVFVACSFRGWAACDGDNPCLQTQSTPPTPCHVWRCEDCSWHLVPQCDTTGDGNPDSCFNCDSNNDGVDDDCAAAPVKDGQGNTLDPCDSAVSLGLTGGSGNLGGIVCKDGVQTACVFTQNAPFPGPLPQALIDCIIEHEELHETCHGAFCESNCGWGRGMIPSITGGEKEECDGWGESFRCLQNAAMFDPTLLLDDNFTANYDFAIQQSIECQNKGYGIEFNNPGCG